MPPRTMGNIGVQLGTEVTPGTGVAADTKLMGLKLTPKSALDITQYRASGYKLPVGTSVNTDLTEADWEGPIDYRGILWPLSSIFGAADTTEVTEDLTYSHVHGNVV